MSAATTRVIRDGSVGPDATVQRVTPADPFEVVFEIPERLGQRVASDTLLHSFARHAQDG